MPIPLDDWQFWVVTAMCLSGLWLLVRPFIPCAKKGAGGSCPSCSCGNAANAKTKRTSITINGHRV